MGEMTRDEAVGRAVRRVDQVVRQWACAEYAMGEMSHRQFAAADHEIAGDLWRHAVAEVAQARDAYAAAVDALAVACEGEPVRPTRAHELPEYVPGESATAGSEARKAADARTEREWLRRYIDDESINDVWLMATFHQLAFELAQERTRKLMEERHGA